MEIKFLIREILGSFVMKSEEICYEKVPIEADFFNRCLSNNHF